MKKAERQRTDAEAEAPVLWPPEAESTHWKRPCCWERLRVGGEGAVEDEMIEWQHRLSGHAFEQDLGDREGQGGLACCSPWHHNRV